MGRETIRVIYLPLLKQPVFIVNMYYFIFKGTP